MDSSGKLRLEKRKDGWLSFIQCFDCLSMTTPVTTPLKQKKPLIFKGLSVAFAVWTGLEPATPCVTGRYSNQLNYQTKFLNSFKLLATANLSRICFSSIERMQI